jgi:hypothetical protein
MGSVDRNESGSTVIMGETKRLVTGVALVSVASISNIIPVADVIGSQCRLRLWYHSRVGYRPCILNVVPASDTSQPGYGVEVKKPIAACREICHPPGSNFITPAGSSDRVLLLARADFISRVRKMLSLRFDPVAFVLSLNLFCMEPRVVQLDDIEDGWL